MKIGNGHVIIRLVLAFLLAAPAPAFSAVINGELKKARLENLSADPTGTNGKVYFNTTTTKGRIYNGTAWTDIGSGSGGGGFTDQITNGNAEDTLVPTAWTTYNDGAAAAPVDGTGGTASQITAIARDTTAGNLINGTATWKMVKSAANAQGQGWSYAFTPPANWSGRNSLVSLTFNYFMSTASGDDIRVYLYDVTNSTLITPSFVTCGGGTAPKLTATTSVCQAKLAFVSTTATSYRLVFHVATTLTTAMNLFVDDISITDGRAQPGVNLGPWTTYTPTITNGSTSSVQMAQWRGNGENIDVRVVWTNTGSPAATPMKVSLPTGFTAELDGDTQVLQGSAVGSYTGYGKALFPIMTSADTSNIQFGAQVTAGGLTPVNAGDWQTSTSVQSLSATVRVNERVGGTSFGENQVQYGSHDGTTVACNNPTGSLVPTTTPAGTKDDYDLSSCFPNRQTTDSYVLEWQNSGTDAWVPQLGPSVETCGYDGTQNLGACVRGNGSGVFLTRGKFANRPGQTWAVATSAGSRWRVKRFSGGSPVPFGLATSSTPGLYQAGAAPGATSGAAIAAGNVGEEFLIKRITDLTAGTSNTYWAFVSDASVASLPLTPGIWQISGVVVKTGGGAYTALSIQLSTTAATTYTAISGGGVGFSEVDGAAETFVAMPPITVNISAATTIYPLVFVTYASTAPKFRGNFRAVRIQ